MAAREAWSIAGKVLSVTNAASRGPPPAPRPMPEADGDSAVLGWTWIRERARRGHEGPPARHRQDAGLVVVYEEPPRPAVMLAGIVKNSGERISPIPPEDIFLSGRSNVKYSH